jgi:hypothetical protein
MGHSTLALVLLFLCAIATIFGAATATASVYDLTADWSDQSNPNGVWSYNWNNVPLPSVYRQSDPWQEPQISWGDLPGWFRSNGTEEFYHDWLAGDVITHTPSAGDGYSDVDWISPSDGMLTISGAVWPCRDIGRWVDWVLLVDGVAITGGSVGSGDPYSRDDPMDFTQGSGGPGVLADIPVHVNSRIELRLSAQEVSYYGDYCGARMTMNLTPAGVPVRETTWGAIKRLNR